jgi:orotidine-5'-phosphate decarboxylase
MKRSQDRVIIVALDFASVEAAQALLVQLDPQRCRVKIGKELFVRGGPSFVQAVINRGFDVFLDLKFHDIPNTVAAACHAAADLGVWMVNVHASGGSAMLQAARAQLDRLSQPPLLIGVTVLTSLTEADLTRIGCPALPADRVVQLAQLCHESGCDGIVCSPLDLAAVRQRIGDQLQFVTPGIRPSGVAAQDQQRIATPVQAWQNGAHYLVIGRPITQAPDPLAALMQIESDLAQVMC